MTSTELETRYRAYLTTLNERRLDDLAHHVRDEVTYNGEKLTRRQYRDMIAADVAAIPDLFFDARIVVATDNHVACRIAFDCTPQHPIRGLVPDGRRVSFTEHVFYRFDEDRIAEVWSLIDWPAVEAQLRS